MRSVWKEVCKRNLIHSLYLLHPIERSTVEQALPYAVDPDFRPDTNADYTGRIFYLRLHTI